MSDSKKHLNLNQFRAKINRALRHFDGECGVSLQIVDDSLWVSIIDEDKVVGNAQVKEDGTIMVQELDHVIKKEYHEVPVRDVIITKRGVGYPVEAEFKVSIHDIGDFCGDKIALISEHEDIIIKKRI